MSSTLKQYMKEHFLVSHKQVRKNKRHRQILQHKWQKKLVRENQKSFNILEMIPKKTFYCYTVTDVVFDQENPKNPPTIKTKSCPFHYMIEIPEAERETCVGLVAMGQTHIGGCRLLGKTDNDFDGWGLLWDGCKSCGINEER